MGSLFGSITVKGNRLTDLVGQTSAVGRPIPFGYGYCHIDEPNVIWTAGIPKEHVKKKKQGKGGVKTEEYTYTLSYAIAFMAGPVYGFLTIKRGGKVVYTTDPNASVDDKAFAAKWRQKARFYYGTRTQMPDATIESYVGAGKVSAFRDLCYIVVVDDDVTSEGGAVPQYEAVIIASPPDVYVSSHPFPTYVVDGVSARAVPTNGELRTIMHETFPTDELNAYAEPLDGYLRTQNVRVPGQPDGVNAMTTPMDGALKSVRQEIKAKPEAFRLGAVPQTGLLKQTLIPTKQPAQGVTVTTTPLGGTLA